MPAESINYRVSSRAYLARARNHLLAQDTASLFYAAFELRCGVEARMQEYLEVWDHVSEKQKRGWQIPDLGRSIESAFRTSDKIVRFAILNRPEGNLLACFYYTPVTQRLRTAAARLGNYLHAMYSEKSPEDVYWSNFRQHLDDVSAQLTSACRGTLMGPPLLRSGTNKVDMKLELPERIESDELMKPLVNTTIHISVSYLDDLPEVFEESAYIWDFDTTD